jgi:hypothetical protein
MAADTDGNFYERFTVCPACNRINLAFSRDGQNYAFLYPRTASREPVAPEVPAEFGRDYVEACNVIDASPKASAALSRRCLQHILRAARR